MSLYEIGDALSNLPAPRRQFFNKIVAVSGLSPNSVKMLLCSTQAGYVPGKTVRKKIAVAINRNESILFPEDRKQYGSIVYIYQNLSTQKTELQHFIKKVAQATRASPKTVRKWLKQRRVPSGYVRKRIAEAISMSIVQLFPQEEGSKS